jgi:small subunit ribosomal protein S1
MKVAVATASGFCSGVKRAILLAERAACGGGVYALGSLVHNPQEMARLEREGVRVVQSVREVPEGSVLLIRAHGAPPDVYRDAEERGLKVIDATCPHVARLVKQSECFVRQGYQLVILGDRNHPEVQGVLARVRNAQVVTDPDDIALMDLAPQVALVAQTTTRLPLWEDVVRALEQRGVDLVVGETICQATAERQAAAVQLCQQVDIMVVVGGYNSANTKNLVQLCAETGTPTHHVETAADLDPDWFYAGANVGITAGASTPDWIIKEVVTTVENMENKNMEMVEKAEEVQAEVDAKQDQAEEAREQTVEAMDETQAGLDDLADIKPGQIVEGTVVRVTDSEVYVDIRYKSDGVIPLHELSNLPNVQPADVVQEGDRVKVVVLRLENKDGNALLSKRRADAEEGWIQAEEAQSRDEIVTGQVVEVVKGGLIVSLFNLRAFLPASLVDTRFVPDLSVYVGQDVSVKIIEMEAGRRRLVVSRKAAIEQINENRRAETWAKLEEGQIIEGTVQRLTDFGAFVDIGGVDGLVHVSEISWGRVNHPAEALQEGQVVKVKVLGVDRERERISLSMKHAQPDPWTLVAEQFKAGEIVKGQVMRTVSFGAFVQIMPGVEGLVHISQLSNERVERTEDVVSPGDEVDVRILSINPEERRVSLSMRDPDAPRGGGRDSGGQRSERRSRREGRSQSYREDSPVTLGDMFGNLFEQDKRDEEEDEPK